MSDFEPIEIQIEASATKANSELDKVDQALQSISQSIGSISGMLGSLSGKGQSVSSSLNTITSALNKINPNALKGMSQGMQEVGKATDDAAKQVEGSVDRIKTAINESAKEIKSSFGVSSKEGMEQVKSALSELYETIEKFNSAQGKEERTDAYFNFSDAKTNLENVVKEFGTFKKEVSEADKQLLDFVRNAGDKIYISPEIKDEWKDDFARMRSELGKAFTSSMPKGTFTEFDTFMQSIKEAQPWRNFSDNSADAFGQLVEAVRSAKAETMSFGEAVSRGLANGEELKATANGIGDSFYHMAQSMSETNGIEKLGQDAKETANEVTNAFDNIQESIQKPFDNIDDSKVQEVTNDVKELQETTEKLGDTKVNANPLEGINEAIEETKKKVYEADSAIGEMYQELEKAKEVYNKMRHSKADFITEEFEEAKKTIAELTPIIKEYERSIAAGNIQSEKFGQAFALPKEIGEIKRKANDYKAILKAMDTSNVPYDDTRYREISAALSECLEKIKEYEATLKGVSQETPKLNASDMFKDLSEKLDKATSDWEKMTLKLQAYKQIMSGIQYGKIEGTQQDWDKAYLGLEKTNEELRQYKQNLKESQGEKIDNEVTTDTWEQVLADIEKIRSSFGDLTEEAGEFNAKMQISQEVVNRINQAMSQTKSGKMLIDSDRMREANEELHKAEESLKIFYDQFKEPVEMDTVQPRSELGKLYDRAKELQELLDSMKNNRIQFDTGDVQRNIKELEKVNEKIKDLEGRGKDNKGSLEWMAGIIAIQHELEKASQTFNRFSEIAKKAFIKALTPLKLFKHELEEIKGLVTMVSRIGSAFAMISKPITKVFNNIQKKATQTMQKITKHMKRMSSMLFYMLIRKAFHAVLSNISEATQSLAKFSKSIGTDFNNSMSHLLANFRYLGASLVAMFAPILNFITPSIDNFTDAIVNAMNQVTRFLAVITGAKSYTIAKKKIVDYTEAMEDANKKAKQLTLGIDELNILNESQSDNKDAEDMFDWMEVPTPQIDIPDWIKWLKDLLKKLWDGIKGMLAALWDAIKKAWVNVRDFFIDAIKHLIESIVGLILDIIRDLTRVFKTKEFQEFLERVMRIIAKIAELIATIIDRIRVAWNTNELGYRILMDILAILNTIATHIENMLDMTIKWAKELDFVPLFEAIEKALRQVNYAIDQIGYTVERVWAVALDILKLAIEDYIPRLIKVLGNVIEGIGNIFKKLNEGWDAVNFRERFVAAFDGIVQAVMPHVEAIGEYFKEWANGLDFKPLLNSIIKLFESLKPVADFIGGVFEDIITKYVLPMVQHLIEKVIPKIADAISHFAESVDWGRLRESLGKVIEAFEHMQGAIGEGVADAIDRIGQAVAKFVNSDAFHKFLENLANFMNRISPEMISNVLTGIGIAILRIAEAVVKFVNSEAFQKFLNSLINFLTYSDADKIASILLNIAKAIIAFKFLSFVGQGFANFLSFVALLGKGLQGLKALKDFFAAKEAIEGVGEAATKAGGGLSKLMSVLKTIGSAIGSVIKIIGGVAAVIGGSILAIKEFVDMWKNGWDVIKTILEALGIAIAAVGAVILGAPALVAGVVAGIIFAISQLAIVIHDHWEEISKWFSETWSKFKDWCIKTWENITSAIAGAWSSLKEKIANVWDAILNFFKSIWDNFKTWAMGIWNAIVDVIIGVWNAFIEKMSAVWAMISGWFLTIWEGFKTWVAETWTAIVQSVVDAWNGFVEKIQAVWEVVYGWFVATWENFKLWVGEIWNGIVQTICDVWALFTEKMLVIWDTIVEWFTQIWDDFTNFVKKVWDNITSTAANVWKKFTEKVSKIWETIKKWFSDIWNAFMKWTKEIWSKIVQTAVDTWNAFVGLISKIWENIKRWFVDTWERFKNWVKETWDSIVEAIMDVWKTFTERFGRVWNSILAWLSALWADFKKWVTDTWNDIINAIIKIWEDFKKTLEDIWGKIVKYFKELWDDVKSIWERVWNGIIKAIHDIWNKFISGIKSIWKKATDFLEKVWDGVKSAWENTWKSLGDFIKNVINGILSALGALINGAISGINAIIKALNKIDITWEPPDWAKKLGAGSIDIGFNIPEIPHFNIPKFANGGFPEDGLFFANHNELIGGFNGRTAVANNSQITDGIAQAVSSSLVPILTDIAQSSRETANKDLSLSVDSREIARANSTGQAKLGKSLISFT